MVNNAAFKLVILLGESNVDRTVYSKSYDDMILFMKQHGFTCFNQIKQVSIDDYYNNKFSQLKIRRFKSNKSDEIINIITSDNILLDLIEYTANEIETVSMFASSIIADFDVPIIKIINDLVFSLRYTYILDHMSILSEDMNETGTDNIDPADISARYVKLPTDVNGGHVTLSEYLKDLKCPWRDFYEYTARELEYRMDRISDDDIMPITYDSYVSHCISSFLNIAKGES